MKKYDKAEYHYKVALQDNMNRLRRVLKRISNPILTFHKRLLLVCYFYVIMNSLRTRLCIHILHIERCTH